MHSTLMTAMGVIFFLGANGGIVLALVQDKPITESVHFTTAMIGFAMLAAQGSITKLFSGAVFAIFPHTARKIRYHIGREPITLPSTQTHTHTPILSLCLFFRPLSLSLSFVLSLSLYLTHTNQTERAVCTNSACLFWHRYYGPLLVPCFAGKMAEG